MKVLVVSAAVPFGGRDEDLLAERLCRELRDAGKDSDLIRLPFDGYYRDLPAQMFALRLLDLTLWADTVIAVGVTAWAVQHSNKRVWFFGHYRPFYELWNSPYGVPNSAHAAVIRREVMTADSICLGESSKIFAVSATAAGKLRDYNGLSAEVLFSSFPDTKPLPNCEYGDYIYCDGDFCEETRHDLAIKAMQKTRTAVRLVVAVSPGRIEYREYLEQLARNLGLSERVTVLEAGLEPATKLTYMAKALACAHVPYAANWWGWFVTRAYQCKKPVITCSDSDGVKELVQPGKGGIVTAPNPDALGDTFDRLYSDRKLSKELGEEGFRAANASIPDWSYVVERLLG